MKHIYTFLCLFLLNGIAVAGDATIKWKNGSYTGDVSNGVPHGQGTWIHPGGMKYVGEYKDGKRHGWGTENYGTAATYVGEWENGKWHGQGTWTDTVITGSRVYGYYVYVGEFRNGERNGWGVFTEPGGHKYEGEWKDGKQHGQGTFTTPEDTSWGRWLCIIDGLGGCYNKYVGEYKDGKRHGHGTVFSFNGASAIGEWENGIPLWIGEKVSELEK